MAVDIPFSTTVSAGYRYTADIERAIKTKFALGDYVQVIVGRWWHADYVSNWDTWGRSEPQTIYANGILRFPDADNDTDV